MLKITGNTLLIVWTLALFFPVVAISGQDEPNGKPLVPHPSAQSAQAPEPSGGRFPAPNTRRRTDSPNGKALMAQVFFFKQQPGGEFVFPGEMVDRLAQGGEPDYQGADSETTTQRPPNLPWGKMAFSLDDEAFNFTFSGEGLRAGSGYTLIYLPDPLPGDGLICLGSGLANPVGGIRIKERLSGLRELPVPSDAHWEYGAKFALVHSGHVDCFDSKMTDWASHEYLFGLILMQFDDTNCDIVLEALGE